MCGICGIIDFKSNTENKSLVKQAVDAMPYRGPDSQGFFNDDIASLGHVRLSIIDLNERSNQPFTSACGRYVMVYNGEAYNFEILQNKMKAEGFQFRSSSDTEVLLEGFIKYGENVLQHLAGMWAFFIWDKQEKKAFMARDRFGEKPFYFNQNKDGTFAFASNLAAIKKLLKDKLVLNPDGVRQLLNNMYLLADTCIYKGIKKIQPGHLAWLTKAGFETKPYWEINYKNKEHLPYDALKKEVKNCILKSVEQTLVSDVPVGLFLSGGVDSGVVSGVASSMKKDMMAITMTVPGNKHYDEEGNAEKVAKHCGLQHHKIPLDETCISLLPKALATMEPLADNSLIPSLFVAKHAGQHLRVMLSGDGGDEIFGGYGVPLRFQNIKSLATNFSDKLIKKSLENSYAPGYKIIANRLDANRMVKWAKPETYFKNGFLSYDLQSKLFADDFWSKNESASEYFERSKAFTSNVSDAFLWTGIHTVMENDFLFKMDSANMMFSVENRSPFLNHPLIELTSKATINELMPNGIDKQMLKEIGEDFIPKEVLYDKKKGFAIPIGDFLNKRWIDSLQKMAAEKLSAEAGVFKPEGILYIIHLYKKNQNHRLAKLLYAILIFELWLRVFHLQMDPEMVAEKYL